MSGKQHGQKNSQQTIIWMSVATEVVALITIIQQIIEFRPSGYILNPEPTGIYYVLGYCPATFLLLIILIILFAITLGRRLNLPKQEKPRNSIRIHLWVMCLLIIIALGLIVSAHVILFKL